MKKTAVRKVNLILVSMNLKILSLFSIKRKNQWAKFFLVFDFSYFVFNELWTLW